MGNDRRIIRIHPPLSSPFNTLYLKLQCPAVQPPLVAISNNGHNVIDFGQVPVGESFQMFTWLDGSSHTADVHCFVYVTEHIYSLCCFVFYLFVGEKVIKRLTVQNISKEPLDVSFLYKMLLV